MVGTVTRIGIVDDHPAVILGVTEIINAAAGMVLAASSDTVSGLLAPATPLDVVLLDLVLADGSTPTSNVRTLSRAGLPAVAFTSGDRPRLVREAGRAGAIGMIRKSEPPAAIVDAIVAVGRGEVVASADWAAAIDSDTGFVAARLSSREAQVLALYASGETAERVGAQLFISRETVLDHVRRIRTKYVAVGRPAHTKVDLYRRAVEDGIVRPGADDAGS